MPGAQVTPRRSAHVLVVEDEYLIADELCQTLARGGATVVGPASTVAAALRLIGGDCGIDMALLDINLKGEMVFPVADALAERGIPFAFVTGYSKAVVPSRFEHVPCWEKPVDFKRVESELGLQAA